MRSSRTDRLLLDGPDFAHAAVRGDRPGRRDLVAVVDVASAFLENLQRERKPGRRSADVPEIEPDAERHLEIDRGLWLEADDWMSGGEGVGGGLDVDVVDDALAHEL